MEEGDGRKDLPPASPADAPMPTLDPQVDEEDEEETEYDEAEEDEEAAAETEDEEEEEIPDDADGDNVPAETLLEEEDDEEDLTEEDFLPEETESGPPKIKEEEEDDDEEDDDTGPVPRKRSASVSSEDGPKRKLGRSLSSSAQASTSGEGHDNYCWVCHKEGVFYHCKSCPRSYHTKCITLPDFPDPSMPDGDESKFCVCPECLVVLNAENVESRSEAMKQLSMDELMNMLKYICGRMRATPGSEPFLKPVNPLDAVDYRDYIVHPMDIFTLEKNIKMRHYGSTEAFLSEAQWLVHNSIIFNSSSSPYTAAAKRLLKVCKQELAEIETCPECYNNAHIKADTWFIEACKRPHILVWAKLKGFPFWPAKAMKIKDESVDVRFFGQHDRAWVALKDCFLYSSEMPSAPPKKNSNLLAAIDELNAHVEKLKEKYGEVVFHPAKTHLGPSLSIEQIRKFTPKYVPEEPSKQRASVPISTNKGKTTLTATPGKSPISITISLKSNPTIVNSLGTDKPGKDVKIKEEKSPKPSVESQETQPATQIAHEEAEDEEMEEEPDESELQIAEKPLENTYEEECKVEVKGEEKEEEEMDVPSGEILASALGLRKIQRKNSTTTNNWNVKVEENDESVESKKLKMALQGEHRELVKDLPLKVELRVKEGEEKRPVGRVSTIFPSNVRVLEEDENLGEDEDEGSLERQHQLMQISSKAQSKPGYRFNITKDISISAISEGEEENEGKLSKNQNQQLKNLQASLNLPQGMQITSAVTNPKHRFPQDQTVQRFLAKGDIHARASIVRAGQTGQMKNIGNPAMKHRMGAGRTSHQQLQMLKRSQGKGIVVDSTSLQRVDEAFCGSMSGGAITLPGGTITVTPLSSFPSGQNGGPKTGLMATNGMTLMSPDGGGSSPMNPSTLMDRSKGSKKGRPNLPPALAVQVQSLSKGVMDLVRNAVEAMAAEFLENGSGGRPDPKALLAENEKLKVYYQAEILELRHNHDIAMRELRLNMENEKKRAVGETRRQLEQDKKSAVEETKKKQWCANCGREALFYCCWNTSYCGYNCQENHWPSHLGTCTQSQGGGKCH